MPLSRSHMSMISPGNLGTFGGEGLALYCTVYTGIRNPLWKCGEGGRGHVRMDELGFHRFRSIFWEIIIWSCVCDLALSFFSFLFPSFLRSCLGYASGLAFALVYLLIY